MGVIETYFIFYFLPEICTTVYIINHRKNKESCAVELAIHWMMLQNEVIHNRNKSVWDTTSSHANHNPRELQNKSVADPSPQF